MGVVRLFQIFLVSLIPTVAIGQVSEGEIFGYRIGEKLLNFHNSELRQEIVGGPFVSRPAIQASPEFDELFVYVTPVTGTIMGIRAAANFDDKEATEEFANRLYRALTAKFGDSKLVYCRNISLCLDVKPPYKIEILPPETAKYFNIVGDFAIDLMRHVPNDYTKSYSVQVTYYPSQESSKYTDLINKFNHELDELENDIEKQIIEKEKSGVLIGIE